ncbi:ABC transporter ATP-binding protein [Plantactinospora sp. GCM10030261]|uniref:ABC transporter ATP-binding protein n=1 Tax=Plantactinospora sp. GCM10030261 TaxID=3273420 RepID=UPI00360AB2A1
MSPDTRTGGLDVAADADGSTASPILRVRDLHTRFWTGRGTVHAVRGVSFDVRPGEIVGVVGESGSGKSATAMSVPGLLPPGQGAVVGGSIEFEGVDLRECSEEERRRIRGRRIGVVFQDASTALNPVMTVGGHLREALRSHQRLTTSQVRERSLAMLDQVGIAEPERVARSYPHQLSGGMKQRVMIAVAVIAEPTLVIADEPTTALDVTIQAQILTLLTRLSRQRRIATLLITHDMGVIAQYTDRTVVMYAGQVIEAAPTSTLFRRPVHPYTRALLDSVPPLTERRPRLTAIAGAPPDLSTPPTGCAFATRCRFVQDICRQEVPLAAVSPGHAAACVVRPEFR